MRLRVNALSTVLAADHRPAHEKDKDLDETRTEETLITTFTNSKHCKRWVGTRHLGSDSDSALVDVSLRQETSTTADKGQIHCTCVGGGAL